MAKGEPIFLSRIEKIVLVSAFVLCLVLLVFALRCIACPDDVKTTTTSIKECPVCEPCEDCPDCPNVRCPDVTCPEIPDCNCPAIPECPACECNCPDPCPSPCDSEDDLSGSYTILGVGTASGWQNPEVTLGTFTIFPKGDFGWGYQCLIAGGVDKRGCQTYFLKKR